MGAAYDGTSTYNGSQNQSPTALQVAQGNAAHPNGGFLGIFNTLGNVAGVVGLSDAWQAVADTMLGGGEIGVAAAALVGTDGAATPEALALASDGVLRLVKGLEGGYQLVNPQNGSSLPVTLPTILPPVPVPPTPPVVSVPPANYGTYYPAQPVATSAGAPAPTVADIVDGVFHTPEGSNGTSLATALDTVHANLDAPVSGVVPAIDATLAAGVPIDNGSVDKIYNEIMYVAPALSDVNLDGAIQLIVKDDALMGIRGVGVSPYFTLQSRWLGSGAPTGLTLPVLNVPALDPTKTLLQNLNAQNPTIPFALGPDGIYSGNDGYGNVWGCVWNDMDYDHWLHYTYVPTSGGPARSTLGDLNILFALIPVRYSD